MHDVPLSSAAIALLNEIAAGQTPKACSVKWPRRGFVFTKTGAQPVTGYSAAKQRLDRLTLEAARQHAAEATNDELVALEPWRFHDLRRTLATGLQRLGVRFEVTEAVLNHISGSRSGIACVYQRHHWSDEKRAALNAWAAHVIESVEMSAKADS